MPCSCGASTESLLDAFIRIEFALRLTFDFHLELRGSASSGINGKGRYVPNHPSRFLALLASILSGCVTTSMQGYADLNRPKNALQRIAVVAPPTLVAALASEAAKRGVVIEDGQTIVPPTRQYTDAEVRQLLSSRGVDGVLVVAVTGDTGVQQQYAGTIMSASYSGTSAVSGNVTGFANTATYSGTGLSSGTMTATSTPIYRYKRTTSFQARLSDSKSDRNLWVGGGQTRAGGALFMGDAVSASDAAAAILTNLQAKGLIGAGKA